MMNCSRQIYQEPEMMMGYGMNGTVVQQVKDTSSWLPPIPPAHRAAATDRTARSALRALLQQPPPLCSVPDAAGLELDTSPNGTNPSSWPPYLDQGDFQTPKVHSLSTSTSLSHHYNFLQPSEPQVGHQGFGLQQSTSNHYHINSSNPSVVRDSPHVGSLALNQEQSELQELNQRRALQRKGISRQDSPVGSRRMGSSLPKEFSDKLQMMNFAQQQLQIRHERKRSFDKQKQISLPEGLAGSNLKFGVTASGIHSGPDNHPELHNLQQQQQQQHVSQGFMSPAYQPRGQNTNTTARTLPGPSLSMEIKALVEDADAMVIKQFQERVIKLDMGTRLSLQESLHRLAKNARKRQDDMRMSNRRSAECDYAAVMDMDLDPRDRTASAPQSRGQVETQTNPVDRTIMNMLFHPLRLPGLQTPHPEHPEQRLSSPPSPSRRTTPCAAVSSQDNWNWSTSVGPKSNNWATPVDPGNSGNMTQAQFHGCGRAGGALEAVRSSLTVTPMMTWTDSPQLTDYASPPAASSSTDASMPRRRGVGDMKLTHKGASQTISPLGGNWSTTSQPVDIRAPRRCDSQSSLASDNSYSSSYGGQGLQFGFHGSSSYGSQDAGSLGGGGQHIELGINHDVNRHRTNQNSAMMNMNADIVGAALSIQSRTAGDPAGEFHPPPSSASHNSNTMDVGVGFFPTLDEDGSHFESDFRGRNLGSIGPSPRMGFFDRPNTNLLRNMVDTMAYTRPSAFFPS